MTNEELLIPRFKVIADYPDNPLPVGEIIEGSLAPEGGPDWKEKFPHIFIKLKWWENRKQQDMPDFLKVKSRLKNNIIIGARHFMNSWGKPSILGCTYEGEYFRYENLEPSTRQEYLDSLYSD